MFGSAPPGYTLPIWRNQAAPPYQSTNNANNVDQGNTYNGRDGGTSGMAYPPPAAQGDPPPPSYGKAVKGEEDISRQGDSYSPIANQNQASGPYAPPIGPPPQAHTAGENGHFVGGFRQN
ncbi:hypothetical protein HWV62_36693 [Athelia sp. TMB]|nr:hypothetical protein HWV62_36693 [Athelia sp. TMB]